MMRWRFLGVFCSLPLLFVAVFRWGFFLGGGDMKIWGDVPNFGVSPWRHPRGDIV